MRALILIVMFVVTLGASAAPHDRRQPGRRQYVKQTFGPRAGAGVAASAGWAHVRHSPREWGQGGAGFGKRLASAAGTHVVGSTINFGVSRARHEQMGYEPSGKRGFGPRMKHALVSTVVTRKTTTGRHTVAAGRISGAFGSGMISRAWQPASTSGVASGLASGGAMLGASAGTHVVREFWPEIRHPRRHHRQHPRG
jgi:hypothetical protein